MAQHAKKNVLTLGFLALSLSLALMTCLSARHHYVIHDGPEMNAYGFPVPWHTRSLVTSMARDIDLKAAVFDFGFYLIPTVLLVFALRNWLAPRWRSVLGASVLAALIGALGFLMCIGADPWLHPAAPGAEWVKSRTTTLQFGWDFR